MSLLVGFVIIIFLIITVGIILYVIRLPSPPPNPQNFAYNAMIVSDLHIEPWYSKGGGSKENYNPDTIDDWNVDTKISCTPVGNDDAGDTPIGLLKSAIENYVKNVPNKSDRLFFFTGDTFSHHLTPTAGVEKTFMHIIIENLQTYFDTDKIFYAVGNHGGNTDKAFWTPDTVSEEWATSLIDTGVFKPSSTQEHDLFMKCGYYKKPIPNSNTVIICINSILYSNLSDHPGCDVTKCDCIQSQKTQLNIDLQHVLDTNKFAYILSHYPIDANDPKPNMTKNFIWTMIDKKYQNIIRGILTGHSHDPMYKMNSWPQGNTWNIPSIFWSWSKVMPGLISSYISVPFPLNNPIELAETDVYKRKCVDGQLTSENTWAT